MRTNKTLLKKLKLLFIILPIFLSNSFQCIIIQPVLAKEDWEDQPLEWYYDNLTDEDRKKIRQAMDYCIPRNDIIRDYMNRYAIPMATEIGLNVIGYNSSIQAREYNTTKASELLAEVFGKRFDTELALTDSENYTNVPFFKMTWITPTTSVARLQWPAQICSNLENTGINIELKSWNWNMIMPRLFLEPAEPIGANFDHDGYDGYFIGSGASTDPDYSGQYYNESFAPTGDNSMYIERADLQAIIRRSLEDPNEANRLEALNDYQQWFHEWVPKFIISQRLNTFPQDQLLEGFDPYNYGRYPWVHNLTHPTETTFTSLVPGDFVDFNPLVSNSWYESVPMSNCFLSLASRRGSYNLTAYPLLANNWTSTPDGMNWTVNLKQRVLFDDGSELTADDVVETYRTAMNASTSTYADDMNDWFANDTDIFAQDIYTVQMNLRKFYPYVTTQVFGLPIMKAEQLRSIGMENLTTDVTNTDAIGLISNGPYKISAYKTNNITLVVNQLYNGTLLGHNATDGIWLKSTGSINTYICTVIKEATAAVNSLENGACDLLDPSQGIFGQLEDIEAHPEWAKIATYPEYGWQEMALNHYDPRWGLNPHDPREMYNSSTTTSVITTSSIISTESSQTSDTPTSLGTSFPISIFMIIGITIGLVTRYRRSKKA